MEIKHQLIGNKGQFYIEVEGEKAAFMEYTKAGDQRIIISHTEVSDILKGKNAGKQLVAAAVDHARKNHMKIMPLCPFTRSVFEKVSEYADVWDR